MFGLGKRKKHFKFAKDNNIGGTAEFFCVGYWSCKESVTLKERWAGLQTIPKTKSKRKKELENLFDFMLTARFHALPDTYQESTIRKQNLTKFGAIGFIATILKVEAELHLNDDYWIEIFFDVICEVLAEHRIPEWIIRGDNLESWDPNSVIEFFHQPPE